jgi:hypothetical protein
MADEIDSGIENKTKKKNKYDRGEARNVNLGLKRPIVTRQNERLFRTHHLSLKIGSKERIYPIQCASAKRDLGWRILDWPSRRLLAYYSVYRTPRSEEGALQGCVFDLYL